MTAVSKNVYSDLLDYIVDKYHNTVYRTIKMKPIDFTSLILMLNTMKILTKKIPNLKLVIVLGFQNTETLLLKDTLKICHKRFLLLVKLKTQFHGLMLLVT